MATKINLIDLYSSFNEIDATVIEAMMEGYNISCSIRTFRPLRPVGDTIECNEKRIAVEEEKVENARKLISEAIRNGVISKEGKFRA